MSLQKILKACAFAAAITFGAGSVQAQTVTLKLSHFVPPQHAFHKWTTAWAEKLEKIERAAEIRNLSQWPARRPAEPPARRGAQRHY